MKTNDDDNQKISCSWCSKLRKPSAYAGDDHFPRLLNICQWCRGVETRRNGRARKPLREEKNREQSEK
jgi:hypothetical protein